jgi:hypothetical protein
MTWVSVLNAESEQGKQQQADQFENHPIGTDVMNRRAMLTAYSALASVAAVRGY